jgi:hypothetical protein
MDYTEGKEFRAMKTYLAPFHFGRRWHLSVALALLILTMGLSLPSAAVAQTDTAPSITVDALLINAHGGPAITVPVVDTLSRGDVVAIIGYSADGPWWQVALPDGGTGWVRDREESFTITGDTSAYTTPAPAGRLPITSTLVFQTTSGGAIYAVEVDPATGLASSDPRYLATGMDPALSPDGQWVAFTRWTNEQPGALGSLWKIRVDGSEEQVIRDNIHQPMSPTWSPDGAQIALNVQNGGRTTYEYMCTRHPPTDPIYNPDEDNPRGIEMKIEFEEDGDISMRFCYTLLPHPYWGIQIVDANTGEGDIVSTNVFAYSPTWDPANPWRIVYRDDEKGLAVTDINQDKGWALTPDMAHAPTNDMGNHTPTFSSDGSLIAVTYWQNDHWDIHTLNADGSGQHKITQTPYSAIADQIIAGQESHSWNNASPAWSPDSSKMAFVTDRTGVWEIWVMNADGSDPRPLFEDGMPADITLQYNGMSERMMSWR